jgi:hypothetical protein
MICSPEDLEIAQTGIRNLEEVLRVAKQTHSPESYRLMSAPFLLELRERRAEVAEYFAKQQERKVAA